MKQIRRGVFETNSSSSHSISIRKLNMYYTLEEINEGIYLSRDGKLSFWDSSLSFDRSPFEPLTKFFDKIRYAMASFDNEEDKIKEIESIMYENIIGLKSIEYPTETDWETDEEKISHGYIDHQSIGVLQSMLHNYNFTLREFLLNKKYVVFIDGDEYNIKEKLFDSGLINKDDFEEVDTNIYDAD
jgi:hypothetical protein